MTDYTDHGLVCLDPDDYAALALAMQTDALAVDAALTGINTSLNTFSGRPWVTSTLTAGNTLASNGELPNTLGSWAIQGSNFTPTPSVFGGTVLGGVIVMTAPRTGWWQCGAYAAVAAVGAVNNFSRRTLYIAAYSQQAPGAITTLLDQSVWRTGDTNTGGENLNVTAGSFYATAGQIITIAVTWSHTNASSNVNVSAGKAWCHFLGSGIEIGSA